MAMKKLELTVVPGPSESTTEPCRPIGLTQAEYNIVLLLRDRRQRIGEYQTDENLIRYLCRDRHGMTREETDGALTGLFLLGRVGKIKQRLTVCRIDKADVQETMTTYGLIH